MLPGLDFFLRCCPLVSDINRGRCALKHKEFFNHFRQFRYGLHCGCTGTDNANSFSFQVYSIVPTRRMERFTLESLHALDTSQFWRRENAVGKDDITRFHFVAAICCYGPSSSCCVPISSFNRRME